MFRTGFLWRFLLALLVAGVLIAAGVTLYRAGYAEGYQTGILIAGETGSEGAPQLPYYAYPPRYFGRGFGFPFFPPFGLFFGIGFFLLIFFLFGGLFRFLAWRSWGGGPGYGPPPGGQHPGWYGQHHAPSENKEGTGSAPAEE